MTGTNIRPQLTHLGINVYDVDAMEAFYTGVLGLVVTDRGTALSSPGPLVFLSLDPFNHHQVALAGGRDPDSTTSTINQISFQVKDLDELRAMYRRVRHHGVADIRPLDHGVGWSIYFPDPEGNNVEIYCDSSWYVSQPHGVPFDPETPTEQILADTEAMCRNSPDFMPIEAFRDRVRAQLRDRG